MTLHFFKISSTYEYMHMYVAIILLPSLLCVCVYEHYIYSNLVCIFRPTYHFSPTSCLLVELSLFHLTKGYIT